MISAAMLNPSPLDVGIEVGGIAAALALLLWVWWSPPKRFKPAVIDYYGTRSIVIEDRLHGEWLQNGFGFWMEFESWEEAKRHAERLNSGKVSADVQG